MRKNAEEFGAMFAIRSTSAQVIPMPLLLSMNRQNLCDPALNFSYAVSMISIVRLLWLNWVGAEAPV